MIRDISFYKLRKRQSNRIKDKGQEQAVHKRGNANSSEGMKRCSPLISTHLDSQSIGECVRNHCFLGT